MKKLCMITGATSGIGRETALALARKGAQVIIVGRNEKKCIKTVSDIKKISANSSIDYICADLSSLKQVREVAQNIIKRYQCLDVLINNAGGYFITRQQSVDGYEMNLALNYLSPFLLTLLLVDMLKASDQGRIINVSSQAHNSGRIDLSGFPQLDSFTGLNAYAQSKLAILLFTYELARKLQGSNVTVNALHPGLVASNFGKNNGLIRFYVRRLLKRGEITPEEGAQTSIYLASSAALDQCTGGYYMNESLVDSSSASYDSSVASQLWSITKYLVEI